MHSIWHLQIKLQHMLSTMPRAGFNSANKTMGQYANEPHKTETEQIG